MIALFVMIFQMQGLGDKGVVYDGEENKSNVKFEDIAGLEEEKNELVEIVGILGTITVSVSSSFSLSLSVTFNVVEPYVISIFSTLSSSK